MIALFSALTALRYSSTAEFRTETDRGKRKKEEMKEKTGMKQKFREAGRGCIRGRKIVGSVQIGLRKAIET